MHRTFSIAFMLSVFAIACSGDVPSDISSNIPSDTTGPAERAGSSTRQFQRIKRGDEIPRPITKIKTDFSSVIEKGLEGDVTLELHITKEGILAGSSVYQSSGHKELDEIALAAMHDLAFTSAKRNGEPYDAILIVPMVFRMPDNYKITKTTQVASGRRKTAQ